MSTYSKPLWVLLMACGSLILSQTIAEADPATPQPKVQLSQADRILILAPHPDDEVLACSGVIQTAVAAGIPVEIVFLTYGDNNEWAFTLYRKHPVLEPAALRAMGEMRHGEAIAAAQVMGLDASHLRFLGYPDFGTMTIWNTHWGPQKPFLSMLTHVTQVPYPDAFRPGAPYKGEEILADVKNVLREFKPTKIFLSHPADHNPDHRSLYLFTQVALWDLEKELNPELYPYLVHFKNWPQPRRLAPASSLTPPSYFGRQIAWQILDVTTNQIDVKVRALDAHKSQLESSPHYLQSFVRQNELFGNYPPLLLTSQNQQDESQNESFKGSDVPDNLLTDEERDSFIGIEKRWIGLENSNMVVRITLSRPLARATEASVVAFGYRSDRSFQDMPKIHVVLNALGNACLDQTTKLKKERVAVERHLKEIIVRIPLDLLGNPDRVLTSARTYLGDVPMDWLSWRTLILP